MECDIVFVFFWKFEVQVKFSWIKKFIDYYVFDMFIVIIGVFFFYQIFGWFVYIFVNVGVGVNSLIRSNCMKLLVYK